MLFILIFLNFVTSTSCQTHPPLDYSCRIAQKQECNKLDFVPGYSLLAVGFDILTMEKKIPQLLEMDMFAKQNNTCTVCNNPHLNKTWQKLPVALIDWRPQSSCSKSINSKISHSSISVAEEASSQVNNNWEVGLDLHDKDRNAKLLLAATQSQLTRFAQNKANVDRYTFIRNQLSCIYYSFRLSQSFSLARDLSQSLESLPKMYDDKTQAQYRQLISTFGTHYISQAKVGGQVLEVNAIKTCRATMDGLSEDELMDCFSIEASGAISGEDGGGGGKARAETCKEVRQKTNRGASFHQTFNERSWQISGGKTSYRQLSFDAGNANSVPAFETWMESLKTDPDIVSYHLEPIHNLVSLKLPQRENLRKAISDYIMEKALRKDCSCPSGSQLSPGAKCSCVCPASQSKSINCCPLRSGLAKVVVTVQSGSNLWGDYISETDAFVKIMFGSTLVQTQTIWDTNYPTWNSRFDLGVLELSSVSVLKVEVWDEDNKFDDDRLGTCQKTVNKGEKDEICYLQHGSVTFKVSVECIPHLTGPFCRDYAASPKQDFVKQSLFRKQYFIPE